MMWKCKYTCLAFPFTGFTGLSIHVWLISLLVLYISKKKRKRKKKSKSWQDNHFKCWSRLQVLQLTFSYSIFINMYLKLKASKSSPHCRQLPLKAHIKSDHFESLLTAYSLALPLSNHQHMNGMQLLPLPCPPSLWFLGPVLTEPHHLDNRAHGCCVCWPSGSALNQRDRGGIGILCCCQSPIYWFYILRSISLMERVPLFDSAADTLSWENIPFPRVKGDLKWMFCGNTRLCHERERCRHRWR